MEELFNDIPKLIKDALVKQLQVPRPSRTYAGQVKPVSGGRSYPPTPPIASGNLIRNIDTYWQSSGNGDLRLVVEMPYYWTWVDEGRRPGRMPPLRAIDRWSVTKKGLSGVRDAKGRFIERRQLNYLRAKSIGQYGFYKTDFVNKAINSVIGEVEQKFGEAAATYVTELIKDEFIIVNL
jgi:hypothetical protein